MITPLTTSIDPVCGMAVRTETAVALDWRGRTYHFCEAACRDMFRDDPERWSEALQHGEDGG